MERDAPAKERIRCREEREKNTREPAGFLDTEGSIKAYRFVFNHEPFESKAQED